MRSKPVSKQTPQWPLVIQLAKEDKASLQLPLALEQEVV